MAIVKTDDRYYKDMAFTMRTFSSVVRGEDSVEANTMYKPSEMANGIGILATDFYELGAKEADDSFWSVFQNNGDEANYYYAFAYNRFSNENYFPRHDIVCASNTTTSSQYIFNSSEHITDTKVTIYANGRSATGMFNGCTALKRIAKLVVHEDLTYSNTFKGCGALEFMAIEGVIGKTIDFSDCKALNASSIRSVINALSSTTSGISVTFARDAVEREFTTSEWNSLIAKKPNWIISLVPEV